MNKKNILEKIKNNQAEFIPKKDYYVIEKIEDEKEENKPSILLTEEYLKSQKKTTTYEFYKVIDQARNILESYPVDTVAIVLEHMVEKITLEDVEICVVHKDHIIGFLALKEERMRWN